MIKPNYTMFKYLVLLLLIGSFPKLFGQQQGHKCAFDHALQQQQSLDTTYFERINSLMQEAIRTGQQLQHQRTIHIIPVAVHVVWKTAADKLAECTIHEQIDVLNEDFRRNNADTSFVRSIFSPIVADTEIEFRLDTIIWTASNVDFHTLGPFGGFLPDPTSLDSVKGTSLPLNPDQYLNIWMVYLGTNGLLGYAYPPDSLANWPVGTSAPTKNKEGVVLHNEIIGRSNTVSFGGGFGSPLTTISTQGRTAVHEVGHYLGLRHIWGDGTTGGLFPQPSCTVDDGVADTPNCLDRSNFDCDTSKNSCDVSMPGDLPDMVENYMDYSEESCMNSFTIGQKNLMRGVLNGPRAGLLTTAAKNRPSNDAIANATEVFVNTDGSCSLSYTATNNNASISIPDLACYANQANDIWFNFVAIDNDITLELLNLSSNGLLAWELMEGTCDSLFSVLCDTNSMANFTNMIVGNTYYLRFYTTNLNSFENFDLCLKSNNPTAESKIASHLENSIRIFPNPADDIINIAFNLSPSYEGYINFYNSLGQQIGTQQSIQSGDKKIQCILPKFVRGIVYIETVLNNRRTMKKILVRP